MAEPWQGRPSKQLPDPAAIAMKEHIFCGPSLSLGDKKKQPVMRIIIALWGAAGLVVDETSAPDSNLALPLRLLKAVVMQT